MKKEKMKELPPGLLDAATGCLGTSGESISGAVDRRTIPVVVDFHISQLAD